jgi:hypothetical protein
MRHRPSCARRSSEAKTCGTSSRLEEELADARAEIIRLTAENARNLGYIDRVRELESAASR